MTIVLFHGKLHLLDTFSRELAEGFTELGYEIFWFDLQKTSSELVRLSTYHQKQKVSCMIGFNSYFFTLKTPSGAFVWDTLGIPCINILVDHPYWYRDILKKSSPNCVILCIDRGHLAFLNRFYNTFPMTGFLPHGADEIRKDVKNIEKREIDVFYAGSLYKKDIRKPDFSMFSFPAEEVCEETIQYLKMHPEETIEVILEKKLNGKGVFLSEEELSQFISSCTYIERIVSSYYRERILELIAKAGISLTLCGNGYEETEIIKQKNVHYLGMISPEEVTEKMQNSKIILNTFPWFKDGSHERVFNGMLRGCVVVTEETKYLRETLPKGSYITYSLEEESMESVPDRIREILSDETQLQSISHTSMKAIQGKHTWKARAKELHEELIGLL
ncbi:MAG: glycosyltransferase [Lachnospiraceae bacterium]|nr:glycosyltransferase [Lachnospiraceae bacterium]